MPQKMENQQFISPSQLCSSTLVGFIKDFLAENNVTILEHPQYPPGLAPADVHLFLQLKSALKGQCFCDAADILKNARQS
jgi:hypothetical protein